MISRHITQRKSILVVIVLCIIIISALSYCKLNQNTSVCNSFKKVDSSNADSSFAHQFSGYDVQEVKIGANLYTLYIADTPEKRTQGLSNVRTMPHSVGLAFIFEQAAPHSFWMKDMYFPLDFVYVNEGKIVDLIENVPPESYPSTILPQYPALVVIELNAGQVKEGGLKIGDPIEL